MRRAVQESPQDRARRPGATVAPGHRLAQPPLAHATQVAGVRTRDSIVVPPGDAWEK